MTHAREYPQETPTRHRQPRQHYAKPCRLQREQARAPRDLQALEQTLVAVGLPETRAKADAEAEQQRRAEAEAARRRPGTTRRGKAP